MEMLIFYWPNLLAGILIAAGLGLIGFHIFARNQALEAFVLGQEIQTSIILIAFILIAGGAHSDHGLHVESLFSLGLAFGLHLIFLRFVRKQNSLRMEISVVYIFLLTALNNLLMSLSPLIEGHMVASLLGDIVTASAHESILIAIASSLLILLYLFKSRSFLHESVEIALFERRPKSLFLTAVLSLFMGVSVHILGLLFTITMLLVVPLALNVLGNSNYRRSQWMLVVINGLSVGIGFMNINWFERIPTSVSIALSCALLSALSVGVIKLGRKNG